MITRIYQQILRVAGNAIDTERPAKGAPPKTLWPFMGWCMSGAWPAMMFAGLLSVLASVVEVSTMFLLGRFVDAAALPASALWDLLPLAILATFLLLIARPILFGGSALVQTVMIGPNLFKQTLSRLHRWTIGQDVTFFDNDFAGRIAQKQFQATTSVTEVAIETVNTLVYGVAAVLGTTLVLGSLDGRLTLILIAWIALYFIFLRVMIPHVRQRAKARAGAKAMVTGQVVDTITNIKTVKLFSGSEHEDRKALGAMSDLRERSLEFGEVATGFRLGLMLLAGLLPVVMVGAALGFRDAGISPGDIATVGALTIRIAQMTGWISFTIMAVYSHLGEVEDALLTLTPNYILTDASGASPLADAPPEIQFDDVSFAYGRHVGGVQNISLTVRAGEKLAIVGASGAGKSTLVALMLRLYDTETGVVRIAGQDVRGVTQNSLRGHIGMVTQETAMFNRSARENVAYGRPDASEDEIVAAARRAAAHEFIQELADHEGRPGYDAYLGERGVKLSGGQRQRIALARAILKDAPILVLDEATSALDSEVEAQIQAALADVMEGKTVIAIAHRLSTIARMDRIVVLDQGRIAEEGTHADLIARNGLYASFWARQSDGFIGLTEAAE